MKKLFAIAFIALATACAPPQGAPTQSENSGALEIRDAWAAASPGGVDVAAGYLTIANGTSADDRLVAASSPRAASVEVHEMTMDNDIMRMRAVEGGLPLPAGGVVELAPGGLHLMFMGVTEPFVEGENIAVTLTFEHAGLIDVTLPVRRNASGH